MKYGLSVLDFFSFLDLNQVTEDIRQKTEYF